MPHVAYFDANAPDKNSAWLKTNDAPMYQFLVELYAKKHDEESLIIARAGALGAVTIATNMAGRGTDIKLGPGVPQKGGLHIVGTERHESRRIDNQLRGRSGRQGDPGSSRFYLSLEDNLMRIFGDPNRTKALLSRVGMREGEVIESKMVTRQIERAQPWAGRLRDRGVEVAVLRRARSLLASGGGERPRESRVEPARGDRVSHRR